MGKIRFWVMTVLYGLCLFWVSNAAGINVPAYFDGMNDFAECLIFGPGGVMLIVSGICCSIEEDDHHIIHFFCGILISIPIAGILVAGLSLVVVYPFIMIVCSDAVSHLSHSLSYDESIPLLSSAYYAYIIATWFVAAIFSWDVGDRHVSSNYKEDDWASIRDMM